MRSVTVVAITLVVTAALAFAGSSDNATLSFEQIVDRSDRIVTGTVMTVLGERVTVKHPATGEDRELVLGFKDPVTSMVYTRYALNVDACIFDRIEEGCVSSDLELWIPGGNTWEVINGKEEIVVTRINDVSAVPLELGRESIFFLKETGQGNAYLVVPDQNARLPIDRRSGVPTVEVRFNDHTLLTDEAKQSPVNQRVAEAQHRQPQGERTSVPELRAGSGFSDQRQKYSEAISLQRLDALVDHVRTTAERRRP